MKLPKCSRLGMLFLVIPLFISRTARPEAGFQAPTPDGRWAILLSGASGDPELQRQFLDQLTELHTLLVDKFGFGREQIFVLFDDSSKAPGSLRFRSTRENLEDACRQIARGAKKEDMVFVFITGHGSFDGHTYKLNLVGPDPTAEEVAGWLGMIPAERMVIVNATSCSGASLASLAQKGRIVVTATKSGYEKLQTHFGQYFIEALKNNNADLDKSGRVSILEAYNYINQKIEESFVKEGSVQTEHPVFNDSGDAKPYTSADASTAVGSAAANTYLALTVPLIRADSMSAEDKKLLAEAQSVESQIDALKQDKVRLPAAEYETKLETLLIRLAQMHAKLRNKQK